MHTGFNKIAITEINMPNPVNNSGTGINFKHYHYILRT